MTKKPSCAMPIITSLVLWVGTLAPSVLASAPSSDGQVYSALKGMGYSNIRIEGCSVSFSRVAVPTEGNNYLTKYDRYVNLRTLDFSDAYEISVRETDNGILYIAVVPLNKNYYQHETQILNFRSWVIRNFPNSNWPYTDAGIEIQSAAKIEAELWHRLPKVKHLNRWTKHSAKGSLTLLPPEFRITYFERSNVVQFMDAIIEQSKYYQCSNHDDRSDT